MAAQSRDPVAEALAKVESGAAITEVIHAVRVIPGDEIEESRIKQWLWKQLASRGWSQAEFSRRSGIAEATLSSWKRNPERFVSMGHLHKIADALEVSYYAVYAAMAGVPEEENPSRWDRFAAWIAEAPELNVGPDDFTLEEFQILVGFAARLLQCAHDGAVRAIHRPPKK